MIRIDAVWLASEPMDMRGGINTVLARVLDAAGIQTVVAARAGCYGAVKFHLNDEDGGKLEMRRNIDAWWPYVEGGVEQHLSALGSDIKVAGGEAHLCCGSAGTYSVLNPEMAYQLRDRKLANLREVKPETIASANIGCITHLQSGTATPVRHWVELLDEELSNK